MPRPFHVPEVVDAADAAIFLGVAEKTLAKWRCYGNGPRYAKLGRKIVYPIGELRTFLERRLVTSTSDLPAAAQAGRR